MSFISKLKQFIGGNQSTDINELANAKQKKLAKKFGTDLVEAEYFKGCCSECAKYRGRWFSISGKDKRFPKMPVDYGCTCIGLEFFPVIEGISEPTHCPKSRNIIEYSNRPFVDDRSKKEKEIHQHDLDSAVFEEIKDNDKADYEKLMQLIPNEMPKSFSAYRRMKISETDNFFKIAERASDLGINIRLSEENKSIIERYTKFEKKLKTKK